MLISRSSITLSPLSQPGQVGINTIGVPGNFLTVNRIVCLVDTARSGSQRLNAHLLVHSVTHSPTQDARIRKLVGKGQVHTD
jgi:hypothetical protein